ncbi:acyl-CoA dehydrogenase family protein [Actinomadura madurae]|uniref:acyl-CoA dehydrogenase family protein n=2 Tax=Actinomadura madurae TaxID=1993 RepID=UPI00202733DB|nr:acyl-CoA dehydrogenase family protein [Actinomadura madurae]MCP9955512.1 acyl-CoA/acyl-ACP dehydrogenase [Actinomadura madurae]MCQ0003695.1 acyl-CoA/acyl-ACP dehydrogenase [Actinomadura madurae]MCQ0020944.1 acyl-CoA/acyl-ACP dehydrogenase [Actinomadura madurae]URN00961.1 acyl-CoA/acyl-ACP dehydrogenase [Actinomadura madurae]URN03113.1 acyl-CoA/acyl-ACP dehydrogenase [Actinomadura madurae]
MTLVPTAEQEQLRDATRRFLAAAPPPAAGPDRETWRRLAEDLGVTGLIVPERHGGAGAGAAELTVVLEEMGAALLPAPFLSSSVLAASLLLQLDGTDLLAGIASGETIVAAAPWWDPAAGPITADADGRLHGRVPCVVDGDLADVFLVVADHRAVFAVDADDLVRRTLTTLDLTRGAARIELAGAAGRPLPCPDLPRALDAAWNLAAVGLAAEQLGVARRCLDMTVRYARTRVQFGRPIGSFQAVKHALADLYVDCELAESAVRHAARAADSEPAELPAAAALALASMTAFPAADQAIHLHGGMGFTWEYGLHLYYRRAKAAQHLLGDPATHLDRLARP